jgi:hypothetical protein
MSSYEAQPCQENSTRAKLLIVVVVARRLKCFVVL